MYKFLASTQNIKRGRGKNKIPKDQQVLTMPQSKKLGINTGHVQGIIYKSLGMLEDGTTPVWIFDGEPLNLKNEEIQ
jgi:5'-3' exonuclease